MIALLAIFAFQPFSLKNDLRWSKLPPIPDPEGFAAPFAGVSHGRLIVAGGANFPDKRPWDGGAKVWYDSVFALDRPDGTWRKVGSLPRTLGYGVSATFRNRVICVGGSDSSRHYADTFAIELAKGNIKTSHLPPLPMTLANGCGTLVGSTLYVAGGQERPDSTIASKHVFALDLNAKKPEWREIPPLPGDGRILSVAASFGGKFYVIGGASLRPDSQGKAVRNYLKDAYRFDGIRWNKIADLPAPCVAAPSPAPTTMRGFFVLGGDDGSQVGKPPQDHPRFPNRIWRYDEPGNAWVDSGKVPAPRVTVPVVEWALGWVIPSGEQRPGVRSPEVWFARLND